MIDRGACIMLGTLTKTHGVDGSLILRLTHPETRIKEESSTVFIEIDGLLVPFFIDDLSEKSHRELIVKLEDIDTVTQAGEITGCDTYMEKDLVDVSPETAGEEKQLAGYRVFDKQKGFVGEVIEFMNVTNNPLLCVIRDKKEFYIPFHPDIVLEIQYKKKQIFINAPEGLFEIE